MTFDQIVAKLIERRCKPSVVARMMKLNASGCENGLRPRGWHRPMSRWVADEIGPKQFIREQGIEAYRKMDKRWWRHTGIRKSMRRTDYLDNLWKFEFTINNQDPRSWNRMVP